MRARSGVRGRRLAAWLALVVVAACDEGPRPETASAPLVGLGPTPGLEEVKPDSMRSPVRIAVGRKGRLFVSDYLAEAIFELEAHGDNARPRRALTVGGRPLGIAWAKGDRLLVGNAKRRSVDVYRASNGRYLYSLGGPGTFDEPTDIAVDPRRSIAFVLDSRARRVEAFRLKDGTPLGTIVGPGPDAADLQNPTGIAVDEVTGEVLVSDYGDPARTGVPPAVKIYSYEGGHLETISGKAGMLGQRFSRPQGLAVVNPASERWKRCGGDDVEDDEGDGKGEREDDDESEEGPRASHRRKCEVIVAGGVRILVVDAVAGEVLVLDRETGELLGTLGGFGSDPGELWLPLDVAVDEKLTAYVTNNRPRRVEVFRLGGFGR
jgi:DNA-binding beta-propeller fold protein YncE